MPAFYNQPHEIADMISHITTRILDQFDLPGPDASRWNGIRTAGRAELLAPVRKPA